MFTYSTDQELSFSDEPPLVKCLSSCTNMRREPGFNSKNPHKKAGRFDTQQSWGSRDKTGPWALLASQNSLISKVQVSVRSSLRVWKKGTVPEEWHQRCPPPNTHIYVCACRHTCICTHMNSHTCAEPVLRLISSTKVTILALPTDICTAKS